MPAVDFIVWSHGGGGGGVKCYWRVNVQKKHTEESGVEPDSRVTDLIRYPDFTEGDTETPQKEKCFFFLVSEK